MNVERLSSVVDAMRYQCRLRELAFFGPDASPTRAARIAQTLARLAAGRYVLGLGPNCSALIRLGRHPIRLGRHAGPLEDSREEVIDFSVDDASVVGPREVSRVHCVLSIDGCPEAEVDLSDDGSTTGTWILPEGDRVEPGSRRRLRHGDLFSLGPSGTNLFLVLVIPGGPA